MQVYIANLGKYNEGELVGAWFTPPINDVEEFGDLGKVPSYLHSSIDYKIYGNDLEMERQFLITNHGVFKYIR